MLDVVRAILAGGLLSNDVILIFTDGEDPAPRYGSTWLSTGHPQAGSMGFVINLEAIGSRSLSLLTHMNRPGRWLIEQYARV